MNTLNKLESFLRYAKCIYLYVCKNGSLKSIRLDIKKFTNIIQNIDINTLPIGIAVSVY